MAKGLAVSIAVGKKKPPMGGGDFGAPAGFGDKTSAPMPDDTDTGDGADDPKIPQECADKLIQFIMSMTEDGGDQGQGAGDSMPAASPATPEAGQGQGY